MSDGMESNGNFFFVGCSAPFTGVIAAHGVTLTVTAGGLSSYSVGIFVFMIGVTTPFT